MLAQMLFGRRRSHRAAHVADSLAPRGSDGGELDLRRHTALSRRDLWHRENEHAVSVGGVGQRAFDGLRQGDVALVRANGPLRADEIAVVLVRSSLSAMDHYSLAGHSYRDVGGLQPRHGRNNHDAVIGSIHTKR